MAYERVDSKVAWAGRIGRVRIDTVRYDDGELADREVVEHPGAAAVVAHDGEKLYMVRQPREPVDEQSLLELPAGKLDEEGESPLECGQRELTEEIGKAAGSWEHLVTYFSSAGFTDEQCHIFLATDLRDEPGKQVAGERIDVEPHALTRLDDVIAGCRDAKTLIGLLLLRARLAG